MKTLLKILMIGFILGVSIFHFDFNTASAQTRSKRSQKTVETYACPMHPEVIAKSPRKCPKCGMVLRALKTESKLPGATSVSEENQTETPTAEAIRIPDVTVYDQQGNGLKFYTDLVKGKTVAINFIFTTCTAICPPLTATFRRVQQELGERAGGDVNLISISVDPTTDTPQRLKDFSAKFKAGPGWTFVTGDKVEIDTLLRALGAAVADKNDHAPNLLIGNDAANYWTRTYGLAPPIALATLITEAAARKAVR